MELGETNLGTIGRTVTKLIRQAIDRALVYPNGFRYFLDKSFQVSLFKVSFLFSFPNFTFSYQRIDISLLFSHFIGKKIQSEERYNVSHGRWSQKSSPNEPKWLEQPILFSRIWKKQVPEQGYPKLFGTLLEWSILFRRPKFSQRLGNWGFSPFNPVYSRPR